MPHAFAPLTRQNLSDHLAQRISELIHSRNYLVGDRLPSINEMARRFGVGHPTLREALKKLQTVGAVEIRHGSGVYVGRSGATTLVISNPLSVHPASKKLLLDLIDARIPLELKTVELAATHATDDHLLTMAELLRDASEHLDDDETLSRTNIGFHRHIALASGNLVLDQLLAVLANLFRDEQRMILSIFGSRRLDHEEHLAILAALQARDAALAVTRMQAHLEGVRRTILDWDPEANPTSPKL
jgi:GntR family transcriptional repressor for pyruvate dehydrogenase complex